MDVCINQRHVDSCINHCARWRASVCLIIACECLHACKFILSVTPNDLKRFFLKLGSCGPWSQTLGPGMPIYTLMLSADPCQTVKFGVADRHRLPVGASLGQSTYQCNLPTGLQDSLGRTFQSWTARHGVANPYVESDSTDPKYLCAPHTQ